ncbi:hypothetical protein D3C87_1463420 [compost metagenome]
MFDDVFQENNVFVGLIGNGIKSWERFGRDADQFQPFFSLPVFQHNQLIELVVLCKKITKVIVYTNRVNVGQYFCKKDIGHFCRNAGRNRLVIDPVNVML